MGRVFNWLVRILAVPDIQDTQCGFKMFTREAAEQVFPLQRLDGWSFDVEVLYIGLHHDLRLVEIPIDWYYQSDSRVRPFAIRSAWSESCSGFAETDARDSTLPDTLQPTGGELPVV